MMHFLSEAAVISSTESSGGRLAPDSGAITGGKASRLAMPASFSSVPKWRTLTAGASFWPASDTIWRSLYERFQGYVMEWGDILEESGNEIVFHFVPTRLIELGARTDVLAAIASNWFESQLPLFSDYIVEVEGPSCIPFSVRGTATDIHQWIGQVFLPLHFPQLLALWQSAVGGVNALKGDQQEVAPARAVSLIHLPVTPGQSAVQAVLMSSEGEGEICFVMWSKTQGMNISGWIPLPSMRGQCVPPTMDFLLDFYRTTGHVISDVVLPLHEPAMLNLIEGLAAAEQVQANQV